MLCRMAEHRTQNALHEACADASFDIEAIEAMIKARPKEVVLQENEEGKTPLHIACSGGSADIVRVLLQYEPEQQVMKCCKGRLPIHLAVVSRYEEIAKILLEFNPEEQLTFKQFSLNATPLHLAVIHKNPTMISVLLEHCVLEQLMVESFQFGTALHYACAYCDKDIVEKLLQYYPVEQITHELQDCDFTPKSIALHFAKTKEHVEILLAKHDPMSQIFHRNNYARIPLHAVCADNRTEAALQLLQYNPEDQIFCEDQAGSLPLHLSISAPKEFLQFDPLRQVLHRNLEGKIPLHQLCGYYYPAPGAVENLLSCEAETQVSLKCNEGRIPLHYACSCHKPKVEVVETLLQHKPKEQIFCQDNDGALPIHFAAAQGGVDVVKKLLEYEPEDQLLTKDVYGRIALQAARDRTENLYWRKYLVEIVPLMMAYAPEAQLSHQDCGAWIGKQLAKDPEWFQAFALLFRDYVLQEEHLDLLMLDEGTRHSMMKAGRPVRNKSARNAAI